jgi:undecaprenyl-phosphate 4-deoxy-4-formamido-L-arabinose transferase
MYNSAATIAALVHRIEGLTVAGGDEIVLVDDCGGRDNTADVARELVRQSRVPITLVEHSRNFGEHNAVLTGWRHARGAYVVNLDDDGQNPPEEAVRLYEHAKAQGLDVVFGHYEVKQHSAWRNFGSWFTNRMTDWALDKPHGFYLSSFRCVAGFVARQVTSYAGPYPYLDGPLLQVTQRIDRSPSARLAPGGESGYTFRRLVPVVERVPNFAPAAAAATFLGLATAAAGLAALLFVIYLWHRPGPACQVG